MGGFGELCCRDIERLTGWEQSLVSQTLRPMRDVGLVRWNRIGKEIYYSVNTEMIDWLGGWSRDYMRMLDRMLD